MCLYSPINFCYIISKYLSLNKANLINCYCRFFATKYIPNDRIAKNVP